MATEYRLDYTGSEVNEKLGKINSLVKAEERLTSEIAVERARINTFTTLGEGSTTGDAELIDIRIGFDGTVYETAGEAVRVQMGQLANGLFETVLTEINESGDIVAIEGCAGETLTCTANNNEISDDTTEITFYASNKNLFSGNIANIAITGDDTGGNVISGNTYRSLICPVKGGQTYTVSRKSTASSNRFRMTFSEDYPAAGVRVLLQAKINDSDLVATRTAPANAKYLIVYLSNQSDDVSSEQYQVEIGDVATDYIVHAGSSKVVTESLTTNIVMPSEVSYVWCDCSSVTVSGTLTKLIPKGETEQTEIFNPLNTILGNVSIVCAKEHTFIDGTPPKIEYFLLEEPLTKKFYFSKDLKEKRYAFTFDGESKNYAFGILQNGDVIAVRYASSLGDENHNDDVRVNPYVFCASENWEIQHEVDFGTAIKPCGWLSNCGFRVLPDGTVLFCEYTRPTVETCHVWRLAGNPIDANNWVSVKTFNLSGNNQTGFKHCHTVQHDHFTNIAYFATGDDSSVATVYASTDSGITWTQIREPSEKYCRLLSFTFTKDYIYWASDTQGSVNHWVFKARRGTNGMLDYSTVEDFIHLDYGDSHFATYGAAYLPSFNAMLLLDSSDSVESEITLKVADLTNGTLHDAINLRSAQGDLRTIGFRSRFSEWYPKNDTVHVGFMLSSVGSDNATNGLACFGNNGYSNTGKGSLNINNLSIRVFKTFDGFGAEIDTNY